MSVVTTNDNSVRLRPTGVDRDGVGVPGGAFTVTIDRPAVASVAPDPDNAGAFLVTPLPADDAGVGPRTVSVTVMDADGNKSTPVTIEFDPGVETGIAVQAEVVPAGSGTAGSGTAALPGTGATAVPGTGTVSVPGAADQPASVNPGLPAGVTDQATGGAQADAAVQAASEDAAGSAGDAADPTDPGLKASGGAALDSPFGGGA